MIENPRHVLEAFAFSTEFVSSHQPQQLLKRATRAPRSKQTVCFLARAHYAGGISACVCANAPARAQMRQRVRKCVSAAHLSMKSFISVTGTCGKAPNAEFALSHTQSVHALALSRRERVHAFTLAMRNESTKMLALSFFLSRGVAKLRSSETLSGAAPKVLVE
eukprot:3031378-Pleurochrysis_carterae.AAC.3